MKMGDTIKFRRIRWTIVDKKISLARVIFYKYKVHRKYFHIWLRNTKEVYDIFPSRWNRLKEKVKQDKSFYPSQLIGIY